MLLIMESMLSLKEKNNTTLIFLLSNWLQVLKLFYDWPVNIMFDDFGIWLLGYRIEFSCLFIQQRYNFISFFVAMKNRGMCIFLTLSGIAPLKINSVTYYILDTTFKTFGFF